MGHFHDRVLGIGANVKEAQYDAEDKYIREMGERYDIRDTTMIRLVRNVPPNKEIKEKKGRDIYISYVPDETAPDHLWKGEWEFEIHSHA